MARTISSAISGTLVLATTDNPLTITSSGSLTATASGADAIDGGSGTSWSITNYGGIASSLGYGVNLNATGSSVFNSGSISGQGAVHLASGASVTNYSGGQIKATGTSGFSSIAGVQISGSGTVNNYGTISANSTGYGVSLDNGGTVTNSGSITGGENAVIIQGAGGQLTNTGTITSTVDDAVSVVGTVVNDVGGSISALNNGAGVYVPKGAGNLQNNGSVSGKNYGVYFSAGGSVTNGANSASASISGGSYGVYITGGTGTVTNAGTISGSSYAVYFSSSSASNKVIVDPGAVFNGAVGGSQGTLELASGVGSITGISSSGSFKNFQKLAIDAGGTWTLSGANNSIANVSNNGTLIITGSCKISTAIDPSSSGQFQLGVAGGSCTLEVVSEAGSLSQTNFVGNGKLIIDSASTFGTNVGTSSYTGPLLESFAAGDAIQILNFSASGTTISFNRTTGLAQISNGTQKATLDFQTSTLAAGSLQVASDGGTGVYVTLSPAPGPTVTSIATSGTGITNGNGDLGVGQVVTLTVNMSEVVTVNTTGGSPTLTLNDGGTATYTGGSGTTALTFTYTVAAGQNTPDLIVSTFNLNGATVNDGAGNVANLSGATNYNPAGTLQINTTAPTISSIATSGPGITNGNGDLGVAQVVTLTVNFSEAVNVNTTGGSPTLTLNDGGTATYTGSSGAALTFSYTVAAGQNTPDLTVSAFNLNGATVKDASGNNADVSGAANYNPAGMLQIDTTPPIPSINQEPPSTTASTSALFAFGTSNIETTGITYAYKLDGATSWTSLSGNSLSLSGLASGTHSIQLQATDAAGNLSTAPASYSWTISPTAPQITTQFSGPSVTTTYPPHNGLGVGPSNIVMVEGSRIEWTNLTGGSPVVQSTYNFFAALNPTGGLYDPRIAYDSVNHRYVLIMEYGASSNAVSSIDIAVSKDSNPNDGWYFAALNTSLTINGQLTASDRPMLSIDGSNIYITAEQDGVNSSGSPGTEAWVISDTAGAGGGIYNGGTLTVLASQLLPHSLGAFTEVTASNGKTYYASSYFDNSQIVVRLATYDRATGTFSAFSTTGLGQIGQGGGNYTAQQQGTSLLLDAGDNRVANLAYSNGFLWGVAEEVAPGSSVPLVHWFKLDVSNPSSPTLVAQGSISGATLGSNVATFNPSLAVDAAGDVLINFTASGPNLYPQDYYAYQLGSSPVGSFSAPILYQASTGYFNAGDGSSIQRWGLNSSTVVDPNNPNSFWISNEYVANNWWQTAEAQIAIPVQPTAPTLTIASLSLNLPAGGSTPLGISVTPANPGDNATVTISGIAAYETITDALDHITFSGNANTLSAAEVNSGLTLNSTYTSSGQPVNTLTVTAGVTTAAGTANSAAKAITVTDPPVTTIAAAPQLSEPSASQHGTLVASIPNPGGIDHLVALMDQFTAAGFHEDKTGAGAITSMFGSIGSDENVAFLATPRFHHA